MTLRRRIPALAVAASLLPQAAFAAELNGRELGFVWALPFVGILLSIALFPLLAPHFWEHHQGKIAAFWAALVVVPLAVAQGLGVALNAVLVAATSLLPPMAAALAERERA